MHPTGKRSQVLKAQVTEEPVRLTYPDQVMVEARDHSETIISEAQKAAERIRRAALHAAERERQAARDGAAGVIAEAEGRRESLLRETREQARAEAEQRVLDEFRPRIEEAVAEFEELIRSTQAALVGTLEKHKEEMVELAVRIAERVILRRAEEDQTLIQRTVVAALEKARERQQVIVRVHPEDIAVLEEFKADLIARFDDLKTVTVEEDRRVDRGGVWVETSSGLIDARIRTQIEEILKSVIGEAEPGSPE